MIFLITGASHAGKTAFAQRLLEKHHFPYLSIDHLKMGLIRSGNTQLTPMSDDGELTAYLWPIVREMIKTAIENQQNLIVEGCYIPFDWAKDFEPAYLEQIRYCCLVMSERYIRAHFADIKAYAHIIEKRLDDSDCTLESVLEDNARTLALARKHGVNHILIDDKYEIKADHLFSYFKRPNQQEESPMKIDITLQVTPDMLGTAWENTAKSLVGHLGTHFDVMDKDFPLEYTQRKAVVFDVSSIRGRDIEAADIDLNLVEANMFVAFRTAFLEEEAYGTPRYFKEYPQLSNELIDALLGKQISIIAIDCAGIRSGKEHVPTDKRCADHGVFVVENLSNLEAVLAAGPVFTAHTYPMRISGITGLPCRVVAEV